RAAVRAEIKVLRRERLAYEQESIQTREALAGSEAYSRALEARVVVLETQARRHEWQRQTADDFVVQHIIRSQALEAGAHIDTIEDTGTPPLLPIPLHVPSTSRRAEIPEADTPPRKRLLLTSPKLGCEVRESSAAAARQPGPTMACSVDCRFVDTMENRFRDTERRMMNALEMVNMRVSYQ
nr:hypothetical protein [Tanacetum cinerariifolium]